MGEAQVWNQQSVSKVPALLVAMYSWLLLAGLECSGPKRTHDYEPLPKWRRGAQRQFDESLGVQLQEQGPRGHVLEPARAVAPVPELTEMLGERGAMPVGMLSD